MTSKASLAGPSTCTALGASYPSIVGIAWQTTAP